MKQSKHRRPLDGPREKNPFPGKASKRPTQSLDDAEEDRRSFVREVTLPTRTWREEGESALGPSAAALLSGQAEPRENDEGLIQVESYRTLPASTEWPDVFAEGPPEDDQVDFSSGTNLSELIEQQFPHSRKTTGR